LWREAKTKEMKLVVNQISQGQAAENLNQQAGENRNAWLKDEMERG